VFAAVASLFALAIGFQIYWAISTELTWDARVRQLLTQDGYDVRHLAAAGRNRHGDAGLSRWL
jgi:hypothetical protein